MPHEGLWLHRPPAVGALDEAEAVEDVRHALGTKQKPDGCLVSRRQGSDITQHVYVKPTEIYLKPSITENSELILASH
jgi:hypothetical protein